MTHDLLETVEDGVALLTLNRPDRLNALSREMLDAMLEALPRLAEDGNVGVVVLTGAGRGFCAGGDVKAMAEGREAEGTTLEERAQALRSRMEVARWLHQMPKPTVAMVRGAAAGAGLSSHWPATCASSPTMRASAPPSRASATRETSAGAGFSPGSWARPRRASSTTRPSSSMPPRP